MANIPYVRSSPSITLKTCPTIGFYYFPISLRVFKNFKQEKWALVILFAFPTERKQGRSMGISESHPAITQKEREAEHESSGWPRGRAVAQSQPGQVPLVLTWSLGLHQCTMLFAERGSWCGLGSPHPNPSDGCHLSSLVKVRQTLENPPHHQFGPNLFCS